MLVVYRRARQKIRIGNHILVTVLEGSNPNKIGFYVEYCSPFVRRASSENHQYSLVDKINSESY